MLEASETMYDLPPLWYEPLQLTITLTKEDDDVEKNQYNEYCYAGGLVEYVAWLNSDKVYHLIVLPFVFLFLFF